MEGGGRQSRLLSRLLNKLRSSGVDKKMSISSDIACSTECGSNTALDEEDLDAPGASNTRDKIEEDVFASNIDLRYGGQYLTPEQLPEFCNQLHNLVEVVRNIQSYAKVTGEYPSSLESRLQREALEVAALAAEARHARDVIARTRTQRRAVRAHRRFLAAHLDTLKDTEIRELESSVRLSDRKLFKTWEALKDSTDPAAFEPLLDEVQKKQAALECLVRLVQHRRAAAAAPPAPRPLPPPDALREETTTTSSNRKRHEGFRRISKFKRREPPRSVPLSEEPSRHDPQPQVSLFIQGTECSSHFRVPSAGTVALPPLDLNSCGSVRDILFFTT